MTDRSLDPHTAVPRPREVAPGATVVPTRVDLEAVAELVSEGARVLDLGCGDGTLLRLLVDRKRVVARGVEISDEGVRQCVAKGLSVHHADLDEGLGDYPDGSFDYVILSQTLQTVRKPDLVLDEMLRVGRVGIVSFPNFGYSGVRWQLLTTGRMPKNDYLPYEWYDTPNIHLLTVSDFHAFCARRGIAVSQALYLNDGHRVRFWPNVRAKIAIFVVHRRGTFTAETQRARRAGGTDVDREPDRPPLRSR